MESARQLLNSPEHVARQFGLTLDATKDYINARLDVLCEMSRSAAAADGLQQEGRLATATV